MQPARRRKSIGVLFVVLFAAGAARAMPVVADEDPISSPTGTVSDTVSNPTGTVSDTVSDPTGTVSDTVSDPTDTVSDTVSDPTDTVSDTVSDPTDTVSDTVSDPTGTVSDSVSDATGAVSTAGSGAAGRGSDYGLGVGASTRGNTSTREGQNSPCDTQTSTCIPDAAGSGFAGGVERILGLLAQTGWAVMPWIVIAAGLTVLGIFLLRSSRRRSSRT
jgi:hypothetical protein